MHDWLTTLTAAVEADDYTRLPILRWEPGLVRLYLARGEHPPELVGQGRVLDATIPTVAELLTRRGPNRVTAAIVVAAGRAMPLTHAGTRTPIRVAYGVTTQRRASVIRHHHDPDRPTLATAATGPYPDAVTAALHQHAAHALAADTATPRPEGIVAHRHRSVGDG